MKLKIDDLLLEKITQLLLFCKVVDERLTVICGELSQEAQIDN